MSDEMRKFMIMALGCGCAYYMFGPVGLAVIALFLLLKGHG